MSTPSDNEINRKLAEFEFGDDIWLGDGAVEANYGKGCYNTRKQLYTECLDALVSIWEKLGVTPVLLIADYTDGKACGFESGGMAGGCSHLVKGQETIQKAAALATYKAVIALEEKKVDDLERAKRIES